LLDQLQVAAKDFMIQLTTTAISHAADIESAFAAIQRDRGEALFVPFNSIVIDHRARIIELASQQRPPAMYEDEVFVTSGGLLSYAPSIVDMYRRSATFVDRILKGASPAELPMEQPTVFKLAVNLRTARTLGLTVRQNLLPRAAEVIE
jgi:putative tryptophan/tyrosine transport system substrate-binding protein